jgi:hypothetical protein
MEGYSPPIHLCLDKKFEAQAGDKIEMYGPRPVMERDGHIVAVLTQRNRKEITLVWEKPEMICHIKDTCAGGQDGDVSHLQQRR